MDYWQHLFSNQILRRGRRSWREGNVCNLESGEDSCSARVMGSNEENFRVELFFPNGVLTEMNCSCDYSQEGNSCEHEAAVLYEMEAEGCAPSQIPTLLLSPLPEENNSDAIDFSLPPTESQSGESQLVFPFSSPADSTYRYFRMEEITSGLLFHSDTMERARSLREFGMLTNVKVSFHYPERESRLIGTVTGKYHLPGLGEAKLSFSESRVESMRCPVFSCKGFPSGCLDRGEPCEHMVLLLQHAQQYLQQNNIGDSTDQNASRVMNLFRQRLSSPSSSERKEDGLPVQLLPRLEKEGDDLLLSFRVGTGERQYVLKHMDEFLDAVDAKQKYILGKQLSLDFSHDFFEGKNLSYLGMIRHFLQEEEYRSEHSPYGFEQRFGACNTIPLFGAVLDEFFEYACGEAVPCSGIDSAVSKGTLTLLDCAPQIKFRIQSDKSCAGVFHGVLLCGTLPEHLEGARYDYYLQNDTLFRTEHGRFSSLQPLEDSFSEGALRMRIGRRNLTEFFYNVLPEIRKDAAVEEPDAEEIAQYLPPEVSFAFYLDLENGCVSCRATARYGEEEFPLTDWCSEKSVIADYRDEFRETHLIGQLKEFFPRVNASSQEFLSLENDDAIYAVATDGTDLLHSLGEVLSTQRFQALTLHRRTPIQLGVSLNSDLLNLTITSDISQEELQQLLNCYQQKKKYYRLKSGDFVSIDESVSSLSKIMEQLHLSPKDFTAETLSLPVSRSLYLDQLLEQNTDIYVTRDRAFRKLIKDYKTVSDSDFEPPESLKNVLRPYQIYGYKWLRTIASGHFGGILADDMGLGKTLQVIAFLLAEKEDGAIGTSLVICPASLVYNWLEEIHRFAPELSVCAVAGTPEERSEILSRYAKWDVLVTSYDLLKRDFRAYAGLSFLTCILDEAQYIKNHYTVGAKSVKTLKSRYRFAMTGTPIENRLSELWSIFDFLMPGYLFDYETFRDDFEIPIVKMQDEETILHLRHMVRPFLLRRLKADVLKDLPEKTEETQIVKLSDLQQKLYDAQVSQMRGMLENQDEENLKKNKIQILAALTKIRQICCDPSLLFDSYDGGSAKREACIDRIQSAIDSGHRILVFSQFTSMLELLEQDLKREHISYYKITGATPKQQRLVLVNSFNDGSTPVFLISLKAGGTGLNLVGADIVIHYDPWWNAAAQNQATDRAHRIGQTRSVTVYKLIAKNSIEEKIQKMQEQKLLLANDIISGAGESLGNLSKDELLSLIE